MPLKTKCILTDPSPEDGLRISIMSRHTLNDGKTPRSDIVPGISFREHWPQLAPSSKLLGNYYNHGLSWEAFEAEFIRELKSEIPSHHLKKLMALASRITITLLCVERTPDQCHRRLVAQAAQALNPTLKVTIE